LGSLCHASVIDRRSISSIEKPSSPAGAACKAVVSRKTSMAAPVRCSG
jgi:hypothetical protein